MPRPLLVPASLLALALAVACGGGATKPEAAPASTAPPDAPPDAPSDPPGAAPAAPSMTAAPAMPTSTAAAPPAAGPVVVRYRVERHTSDQPTAGFEEVVEATLSDPRGWQRAGFDLVRDGAEAPFLLVLGEADEVDRLCLPYDTYGKYSCQNGPVVALNADRWRSATPKWTGDLVTFRQMLVNHEVGHLLGQKHPRPQCPRPGELAPVMNQQATELNGCLPNPWPLDWEIDLAARHDRPLAPGPGR